MTLTPARSTRLTTPATTSASEGLGASNGGAYVGALVKACLDVNGHRSSPARQGDSSLPSRRGTMTGASWAPRVAPHDRPAGDPPPGRSAALTAAFGTEVTAGELHGFKDGRGDSRPLRLSWLRRAR